jgi:RimJ/RimL family protein N-acetyltransferase
MLIEMLKIKETTLEDLENVLKLWNDGEVMRFVGLPDGCGITLEELENWYEQLKSRRPLSNHYSIYYDDLGYSGETGYQIFTNNDCIASLDIKLFAKARGKGIAYEALKYAIEEAFKNGARKVWVDPHATNEKAIALYSKLGFQIKEMPDFIKELEEIDDSSPAPVYMELARNI